MKEREAKTKNEDETHRRESNPGPTQPERPPSRCTKNHSSGDKSTKLDTHTRLCWGARRGTSPQGGQALGRFLYVELRFWVPNRLLGTKG